MQRMNIKRLYQPKLNFSSSNFLFRSFSDVVKFKFVYLSDKKEVPAEAKVGDHILSIAKKYNIGLEGACDASLACSTCHVILEKDIYDTLSAPKEEEEDLLDLTFGLAETSRLGCQTIVSPKFEGTTIWVPAVTKNLFEDGKGPAKKLLDR